MKNFLLLIFLLLLSDICLAQERMPYGVNEEWRICSADSDCTAALRGCWVWEPINKKYIKKFMKRNIAACSKSFDPGFQPVTACIDKVCQATDKTTNVLMTEWLRKNWN